MRYLLIISILLSLSSCDKETPNPKYCINEYISNAEGTECLCPENTHVEIAFIDGDKTCRRITESSYICTLSGDLCFNNGKFTAYDGIGYAQLNYIGFKSLSLDIGDTAAESLGLSFNAHFTEINTTERDDGKLEVSMIYRHPFSSEDCFDWATRAESCPGAIIGYIHGISNIDKSELDLNVEWKDCDGTLLNTGIIHLKKP